MKKLAKKLTDSILFQLNTSREEKKILALAFDSKIFDTFCSLILVYNEWLFEHGYTDSDIIDEFKIDDLFK